jgi:ribonuclease P/MRP protein subunit RPP1
MSLQMDDPAPLVSKKRPCGEDDLDFPTKEQSTTQTREVANTENESSRKKKKKRGNKEKAGAV